MEEEEDDDTKCRGFTSENLNVRKPTLKESVIDRRVIMTVISAPLLFVYLLT
jgi:hypothetical protein